MRAKWVVIAVSLAAWSSPLRATDSTANLPIPTGELGNIAMHGKCLKARLAALDTLGVFAADPKSAAAAVNAITPILPCNCAKCGIANTPSDGNPSSLIAPPRAVEPRPDKPENDEPPPAMLRRGRQRAPEPKKPSTPMPPEASIEAPEFVHLALHRQALTNRGNNGEQVVVSQAPYERDTLPMSATGSVGMPLGAALPAQGPATTTPIVGYSCNWPRLTPEDCQLFDHAIQALANAGAVAVPAIPKIICLKGLDPYLDADIDTAVAAIVQARAKLDNPPATDKSATPTAPTMYVYVNGTATVTVTPIPVPVNLVVVPQPGAAAGTPPAQYTVTIAPVPGK
jgi:hypothetical protein